jgi:hypothetical protein
MWRGTILLEDYRGLEILHLRHYKLLKHVQILIILDWIVKLAKGFCPILYMCVYLFSLCIVTTNDTTTKQPQNKLIKRTTNNEKCLAQIRFLEFTIHLSFGCSEVYPPARIYKILPNYWVERKVFAFSKRWRKHKLYCHLKMAVFWVFRALMMEAARTYETLVNFYRTTRRYNPEDIHLRTHRRENLKSYLYCHLFKPFWCLSCHYINFASNGNYIID